LFPPLVIFEAGLRESLAFLIPQLSHHSGKSFVERMEAPPADAQVGGEDGVMFPAPEAWAAMAADTGKVEAVDQIVEQAMGREEPVSFDLKIALGH
jgi:hypothetical protein